MTSPGDGPYPPPGGSGGPGRGAGGTGQAQPGQGHSGKGTYGTVTAGTAYCPKCRTGYRLNAENLGHRSICVKCGQYFHLLPESEAADTRWEDTTAALNELAKRVWERGLDLRVGQVVLGVYVVQEILGRGGLGQVFKVRHRDWQKELALKLPYRTVMEPGYFASLKNEAETWVALGLHPHVVTCYYARPLMGVPAIFMEYVAGGSLREFMEPRAAGEMAPLFIGDEAQRALRFLDLCIQAAWGLEFAHGNGVLHLDIKPQNLLLEEDTGRLLVTDFGLARAARETGHPTDSASLWPGDMRGTAEGGGAAGGDGPLQPGPRVRVRLAGDRDDPARGAFGTPQYMSPEAVERRPPDVGFDLWSLALTLLELFLGTRPWEHGGAVGEALEGYLAPGRALTPLPPGLPELLRRELSPDPASRFRSAAEMADALASIHAALAGSPYPRPRPAMESDSADNLNNRAVSMLDLGRPDEAERLWKQALREDPAHLTSFFNLSLHRFRAKTLSVEAFQGRLDDVVRLASGKMIPELPLIMCGAYLELGLTSEAMAALDSYDGPALSHEARRLSDILERSLKSPELVERMRPAVFRISRVRDRQPDRDGGRRMMAPLLAAAERSLEERNTERALLQLSEARAVPGARTAPDFLALWRRLYLRCARPQLADILEEGSPQAGLKAEAAACRGDLLVAAGGSRLAFDKGFGTAAATAAEARLASPPVSCSVSPAGDMAACVTQDGHLWLFNPESGGGLGQALAHAGAARGLSFSRDGTRLFTAGDDGSLKMWDTGHGYLDKGTPLLVRRLSEGPLAGLCVSPNGRTLSVFDSDSEYRLPAEKMSGTVRRIPAGLPGGVAGRLSGVAADPFSRYLVSGWEQGILFHPLFDTDWRPDLSRLQGSCTALAVSPDSRLWAAASPGRILVGWAPQERQTGFLPIKTLQAAGTHFLCFSPDSATLLAAGRNGLSLHFLDWDLEPAKPQGWDRRAELVLAAFLAGKKEVRATEEAARELKDALASAGMPAIDLNIAAGRLREAVANSF
ncbi:MAG: protein kinase [Deltaproteobacteria bacterium]|nr:protein kinase [Deltaproteobacteria bacterium]